jgi:hypothetical protein
MEKKREAYKILVWKPAGRKSLEDAGVHCRIIFKWILRM